MLFLGMVILLENTSPSFFQETRKMALRTITMVALAIATTLVSSATISKKDSYGGSTYSAPAPQQQQPAASYDSSSYGGSQVQSYGSGGSSDYGAQQDPGTYGNSAPASPSSSSGSDSYGNLYYYYYPVTNHSQGYGNGGSSSYGTANSYNSYNQQPVYYPQGGGGGPGGLGSGLGGPGGLSGGGGGGGIIAPGGGGNGGGGGGGGGGGFIIAPPLGGGGGGLGGLGFPDPLAPLLSFIGAIDVNSLILPALLIGGVALLLPALLNCDLQLGTCIIPLPFADNAAARSGRNAEDLDYQLSIPQAIDHAARIYDAVHESEQCLQRVVCEMGGMLRNMRGKDIFFTVLEHFASPSIKKQLYVLKEGALSSSQTYAANCDKFKCGKLDNKVD